MNGLHHKAKKYKLIGIVSDFLLLFFPNYCLSCTNSLVKGEDILCTNCILELPKTNYHLQNENPVALKFSGRLNLHLGLAFLKFRKGGIVQRLLHQLKYNNHPEVGIRLGKLFGKELKDAGYDTQFDLIIPVPLHATRKRKRGYNQSTMFAQGLSEALNIPWDESISVRKRLTKTQTTKSRTDRWENVKDVFSVQANGKVSGKRVLLVDDVITTGATLEACGLHLLRSNCATLSIACLAEAN